MQGFLLTFIKANVTFFKKLLLWFRISYGRYRTLISKQTSFKSYPKRIDTLNLSHKIAQNEISALV